MTHGPDGRPEPGVVAEADQMIAQHKELARVVAAYHHHLIEQGVKPKLAADLTLEYQGEIFADGRGGGSGGDE